MVHSSELILHRIFNGDDLADLVVDLVQRGVQRGSLAAACRSRDQHNAVGQIENPSKALQLPRSQADLGQAPQGRVLSQETHDDRFTVEHGNHRDSDIHLVVFDADLDAAVLRQTLLRNVQMTEDLDARNDRRLKLFELGWKRDLLQLAVDAVTNPELVLEGFEVDVRRPQFDGILEHLVDEADDGRLVFSTGIQVGIFGVLIDDLDRFLLVECSDGVGTHTEVLLHFPQQRFAGNQHQFETETGEGAEGVESAGREEPASGNLDGAVFAPQREQLFLEEDASREQSQDLTIRLDRFQG